MPLDKTRIDKWLWSVRIYKTRTQATDACHGNCVTINGSTAKASSNIQRDDKITVKKSGFNYSYQVIDIIDKRVGAPIAQQCYLDTTPPEEILKYEQWFNNQKQSEFREKGAGRPTKKERREIDDYKKTISNK